MAYLLAWVELEDPEWLRDEVMRLCAYACRYGRAGLKDCLEMEARDLLAFNIQVNKIVEGENEANKK